MSYVLRLKGNTRGWIFSEGTQEAHSRDRGFYEVMDTGKMKYADEWETYEEAEIYKTVWDINDDFDIVEYSVAREEYYGS